LVAGRGCLAASGLPGAPRLAATAGELGLQSIEGLGEGVREAREPVLDDGILRS
jgi:hypothetical protein